MRKYCSILIFHKSNSLGLRIGSLAAETTCRLSDSIETKNQSLVYRKEELVTGLSHVSWEKVDVSFHNSRSSIVAHSVIQGDQIEINLLMQELGWFSKSKQMTRLFSKFHKLMSNPRKLNVQCFNCNAKGYYAHDCPQPKVRDAKYFREQMLLAIKDEAGGNLNEEENDFMLDHYRDYSLEELKAAVIMMAHIQPENNNDDAEPT
nr:putative lipase ROG1 [Tanacetum cinerariifolium]